MLSGLLRLSWAVGKVIRPFSARTCWKCLLLTGSAWSVWPSGPLCRRRVCWPVGLVLLPFCDQVLSIWMQAYQQSLALVWVLCVRLIVTVGMGRLAEDGTRPGGAVTATTPPGGPPRPPYRSGGGGCQRKSAQGTACSVGTQIAHSQ